VAEECPPAQVYDALWGLVEGSAYFQSLVKQGNRIKFNKQSFIPPDKIEISTTDVPEVTLVANQSQANLQGNSTASKLVFNYEWWISTGDVNVIRGILPVTWAIWCAMANWKNVLPLLKWSGQPFVKRYDFITGSVLLTDSEKNRGIRGFSSIWGCEVEMWFKTDDLITQNSGA